MIIVGIVGHPASGKDTIADYLISKGFDKFSGGDILREEMDKLGLPKDRTHINEYTTNMRAIHGNDFVSHEIIKRIKRDSVVVGFRNLEEVDVFRNAFKDSFKLIAIEAPFDVRYARARERNRIGEAVSFEQFKKEEEQEKGQDSKAFEVDRVIASADLKIINDGTKEDLLEKVDSVLTQLKNS